jgi:hypothetical protein
MARYVFLIVTLVVAAVWNGVSADGDMLDGDRATRRELALTVQSQSTDEVKRVAVTVPPKGSQQTVSGSADVIGFPFIQSTSVSDIDWKVDGSNVTGTITGKSGSVLGSFEGTITATGMGGKFTHVDGRVGLWSWDGPIPSAGSDTQ